MQGPAPGHPVREAPLESAASIRGFEIDGGEEELPGVQEDPGRLPGAVPGRGDGVAARRGAVNDAVTGVAVGAEIEVAPRRAARRHGDARHPGAR